MNASVAYLHPAAFWRAGYRKAYGGEPLAVGAPEVPVDPPLKVAGMTYGDVYRDGFQIGERDRRAGLSNMLDVLESTP